MDGSVYQNVHRASAAVIHTPAVATATAARTIAPAAMALVVLLERQNVAAVTVTIRTFKYVVMIKTLIILAIPIKNAVMALAAILTSVKLVWM
jgi:hypothetical protein